MGSNPPTDDPRSIWQNQPTETSGVTLVLIRQKARALHTKTRRELVRTALGHLFIVALCGIGIALSRGTGQRAPFAIPLVWGLVRAWISQQGMWVPPMPGDAGFATGIEFYRQELQRRRLLFGRWIVCSFGPVILALGAWIAPPVRTMLLQNPRWLPNAIQFLSLLAIWFVAVWVIRRWGKHDIQREIEELRELERESRSLW